MASARASMPATPLHPHVAALQAVAGLVMFLCATPVALWLLSTVVVPAAGILVAPTAWQVQLDAVASSEARQEALASSTRAFPSLEREPIVPFVQAERLVDRLLPRDEAASQRSPSVAKSSAALQASVASSRVAAVATTSPTRSASASSSSSPVPSATTSAHPPAQAGLPLLRLLGERWRARFQGWWRLQRTYLTLALSRCIYAGQLAFLAAPAALYGYRLGERLAYEGQTRGLQPSPARSRAWFTACRQLAAGIPGCCFLPVAVPTVPVLVVLMVLLVCSIIQARRHAITI